VRESLHAEWTKLRTLASTGWLLLAAAALTVTVSATAAAAVRCPSGGCADDPAKISLTGIYLATALREAAVAIGAVLGLLYLIPIIAFAVGNATVSRHLQQIGPMTAGLAIQATTSLNTLPISPWAGLGVLAAWAAGALLLGGLLLRMRDA